MLFENNDHAAQQHAPAGADLVAFKRADFAAHIRILTMPNKALVVISGQAPCQDADCHIPINAP